MSSPGSVLTFKKRKISSMLVSLFNAKAREFSGLYNAFERIAAGQNKNNYKPLDEFYQRIGYMPECAELHKTLAPLFPAAQQSVKHLVKLSGIILDSVRKAGVLHGQAGVVIPLSDSNVLHYQEWNGKDLYVDDKVRVISPAWYRNGVLIEKGFCTLIE